MSALQLFKRTKSTHPRLLPHFPPVIAVKEQNAVILSAKVISHNVNTFYVLCILGDPGAVSRAGLKGARKVVNPTNCPWVSEDDKQPTPAQVESGVQVPEISERRVRNCLQHLKKTATGPDLIPFWVWRDHAEIFTPSICKIWNLSLRFSTWSSSSKRAHVTPSPRLTFPREDRLQKNQHHPCNCTRIFRV